MTGMTISTKDISELRARTGAGIGDCKKALEEAGGDMAKAGELLRAKGIAKAEKRAGRSASQGLIGIEILGGGASGGMVELDCETDFVARTEEYHAVLNGMTSFVAASAWMKVPAPEVDGMDGCGTRPPPVTGEVDTGRDSPATIARSVSARRVASALRRYTTRTVAAERAGVSRLSTSARIRATCVGLSERMSRLFVRASGAISRRCCGAGAAPAGISGSSFEMTGARSSTEAWRSGSTVTLPESGRSSASMILRIRFALSA